jgi:C4-dicarboxylate transporter, DctQ subunit
MTAMSTTPASRGDPMGALLRRLEAVIGPIETFFNLMAALCILSLMFIGVIQIVARTVFNAPIWGYIDMVELAMALFAFLGISYCQRLGGHVRMELGLNNLSPRAQAVAEVVSTAVALGVVGVLVWYGATHAWRAYESGDSTIDAQFLVWPSKAVVPLALGLLWLRLWINALGYLRLAASPHLQPIGVPVIEDVETQALKEASDAQAVEHAVKVNK